MIKLQSISKSFDGVSVLENISAEIPDSGIFAICGASGSGKTTLMRIILGLEQPDSGNIYGLEGKKAAVVFQNDRLLPWFSALDNVAAVCSKERAKELLEKVELSDSLDKKPAELSGGMCRRVALARALAFDADIFLLDEPFKGLDAELRGRTVKLVEDFAKTKPVILITHDPWEASLAGAKLDIEK
jgi:NitT/TauT family transport system ATP-binding protein